VAGVQTLGRVAANLNPNTELATKMNLIRANITRSNQKAQLWGKKHYLGEQSTTFGGEALFWGLQRIILGKKHYFGV
jgi:hypothetical protein